jgi:actin-like ATPase involved in cell morphogenesis
MHDLIKEGALGQVVSARAQLTCWYPEMENCWRQDVKLSGGGAMLKGLDKMTENVFNIGTTLAMRPMDCVACGLSVANSFIPLKVKGNGKDVTDQLAKYYESGLKK